MEKTKTTRQLLTEVNTCENSINMLLGACLMQNEKAILERNAFVERRAIAVAKLDEKCRDAGIGADAEGFPTFANIGYQMAYGQPYIESTREYVGMSELHALLEWMIIKSGK